MKNDPLKQYASIRKKLLDERASLEARLAELNEVLGAELPSAGTQVSFPARRGRRPRSANSMSLRDAITQALRAKGPLGRKDLAQAVAELGYVSNAKNPLASMGVFLYSRNSPFKRKEGKFYLPGGAAAAPHTENNGVSHAKKKRTMSPEARARIAAAQRARWAKRRRGA